MVEGLLQHQFVRKSNLGLNLYWSIPYQTKGPPQNCLRLDDRAKCCQKLNPSLLKYQKWKSPLKIKSQNQKLNENQKLKIRNEKSPTSSLKIPNLKKRRLMFGLAGLSLQKSKLHWLAVAEGLKTLEVLQIWGPISECRGCFTLQIDRFTMGGVKMINHRGKNSSKRSVS